MNEEAPSAGQGKSKPPMKTVALVLLMLVLEGGAIIAAMMMFGGPSDVEAVPLPEGGERSLATAEVPLLHERFTNLARGVSMVYDTEILLVVPAEHQVKVEELLESKRGQIRAGVSRIWRSAEAAYFNEPGYETLSRQTQDFILTLFDSEPAEGAYIQRVLIPKCMGFRNDF